MDRHPSQVRQSFAAFRVPEAFTHASVHYTLLAVAVLLTYANVYDNDFVYDDLSLITNNKFLTSWHYIGTLFVTQVLQGSGMASPFYRPLLMLIYFLIYQMMGPSLAAFHLLNVALHVLNTCLLYTLGLRLGFNRIATLLAVLVWALHPVQTEAITYVSSTADLLCGGFFLAGILTLAPGFGHRNVLMACAVFVLALLSKETAVVFPALAMGLLFYQSENRWSLKIYLKTWPFWLIAILYFAARETLLNFNGLLGFYGTDATVGDRLNTFLATLPVYAQLVAWPSCLHMERSFPLYHLIWGGEEGHGFALPPQIMEGIALLVAGFAGIAWRPSRRATPLAWGLLWAATVHFPQSGILFTNETLIFEHWLYLPTMGLSLGLGESLVRFSSQQRVQWIQPLLAGLALSVAVLSGIIIFEQNKVWRDSIMLYTHIFSCGENSVKARTMLGNAYVEKEHYELAIDQYRRALAISDDSAETHYNLGAVLLSSNGSPTAIAEAIQHFQRVLEINPDYYAADDALTLIYENIGDDSQAAAYQTKSAVIKKRLGVQ